MYEREASGVLHHVLKQNSESSPGETDEGSLVTKGRGYHVQSGPFERTGVIGCTQAAEYMTKCPRERILPARPCSAATLTPCPKGESQARLGYGKARRGCVGKGKNKQKTRISSAADCQPRPLTRTRRCLGGHVRPSSSPSWTASLLFRGEMARRGGDEAGDGG